jgi:hypothetical protein
MHNERDAKKLCPSLVVQHVATYREGDSEAGYWDDVDRRTHKVSFEAPTQLTAGQPGPVPAGEPQDPRHLPGDGAARGAGEGVDR